MKDINRRTFLKSAAALPLLTSGHGSRNRISRENRDFTAIRFGICTDVHQDLIPDAERRLAAFIESMERESPDFIIQLGDFCYPDKRNREFMQLWNSFSGPKLHVIGNHDPEGKYTLGQVMDFWDMHAPYYSTDINGFHIVVLNGNDVNPTHEKPWKYERYIGEQQLAWLKNDVDDTKLPTIVFCHQGLDNSTGVENGFTVRTLLERANHKAGFRKVQLVFSGHHHMDYHNVINGIHYIQINSMSYNWRGDKYGHSPYSDALNKKYPLMKYMAHYKDPLWALVDIDEFGSFKLSGQKSQFLGRSPEDMGMQKNEAGHPIVAQISDRSMQLSLTAFSPSAADCG